MPLEALDQATGLRRLLGNQCGFYTVGVFGVDANLNAVVAANLSTAMAQRGGEVWLLDEMPAPQNAISQLGLSPVLSLCQLLDGTFRKADGLTSSPSGLKVLRADNGMSRLADLAPDAWSRFAQLLPENGINWLFMAAPPDGRPSLAFAAAIRLLVITGNKAHLTEAYGLLKSIHQKQPGGHWWVVFMNMDDDARAEQMMQAITTTSHRFLEVEPRYLGALPKDGKLEQATRTMRSILEYAPSSPAASAFRVLADALAREAEGSVLELAEEFGPRLGLLCRSMVAPLGKRKQDYGYGRAYG